MTFRHPCVHQNRPRQKSSRVENAAVRVASDRLQQPEIQRFVQHYERITRHALMEMPERADYLLELGADHGIFAAHSA